MNVLVVGSTRGTGRAVVQTLIERGHRVTALSRSGTAAPPFDDRVRVVQGDALEAADLDRAVPGHDAVVVSLGVSQNPFAMRFKIGLTTPPDVVSRGTAAVLEAMRRHGVRRLVVVSAFGVAESWGDVPLPLRVFFRLFLMDSFRDKAVQEAAVHASDADWTVLRPVGLTDKPATGDYAADPREAHSSTIARADVADYAVRALEEGLAVGQTVTLS